MAATGTELPGTAAYGISLLSRYPATGWQVLRLLRIPVRFPMWISPSAPDDHRPGQDPPVIHSTPYGCNQTFPSPPG